MNRFASIFEDTEQGLGKADKDGKGIRSSLIRSQFLNSWKLVAMVTVNRPSRIFIFWKTTVRRLDVADVSLRSIRMGIGLRVYFITLPNNLNLLDRYGENGIYWQEWNFLRSTSWDSGKDSGGTFLWLFFNRFSRRDVCVLSPTPWIHRRCWSLSRWLKSSVDSEIARGTYFWSLGLCLYCKWIGKGGPLSVYKGSVRKWRWLHKCDPLCE